MHRAANVILSVIAVVREKSQKDWRIPFDKQDLKGNHLDSNISGWYSNSFIQVKEQPSHALTLSSCNTLKCT